MVKNKILKELRKIKKFYRPEKLILFGSHATGQTHEASDVDILLVKKTRKRFLDRITDVLKLYNGDTPLDVIVYTPKEFEKMKKTNSFVQTIIKKGVEL